MTPIVAYAYITILSIFAWSMASLRITWAQRGKFLKKLNTEVDRRIKQRCRWQYLYDDFASKFGQHHWRVLTFRSPLPAYSPELRSLFDKQITTIRTERSHQLQQHLDDYCLNGWNNMNSAPRDGTLIEIKCEGYGLGGVDWIQKARWEHDKHAGPIWSFENTGPHVVDNIRISKTFVNDIQSQSHANGACNAHLKWRPVQ